MSDDDYGVPTRCVIAVPRVPFFLPYTTQHNTTPNNRSLSVMYIHWIIKNDIPNNIFIINLRW